jgi:hypothetical protein
MKQLKVNFCAVELPRVVVRSLGNIQVARKELLPTTTNLLRAAALTFQIKLREISLNEIRVIRARLRVPNRSSDVIAWQTSFQIDAPRMPPSARAKVGPPDLRRATNQRGHLQPKNTVCGPQVLSQLDVENDQAMNRFAESDLDTYSAKRESRSPGV